jgi:hypothetical protein
MFTEHIHSGIILARVHTEPATGDKAPIVDQFVPEISMGAFVGSIRAADPGVSEIFSMAWNSHDLNWIERVSSEPTYVHQEPTRVGTEESGS